MRRFLGPTRFHLGAIWELLKGKNYKCRCFILPPEAAPAATDSASTTTPNGPAGNAAADATSSSATSDTTPLLNRLQKTPTAELRGSAAGLGLSQPTRLSDYPSGPPLPVLSQLSTLPGPLPDTPAPLPPGWVQLSDVNSFAMFLGINPQFTSLDARINPGGSFGDGGSGESRGGDFAHVRIPSRGYIPPARLVEASALSCGLTRAVAPKPYYELAVDCSCTCPS